LPFSVTARLAADVTRVRAGEAFAADVAPREVRVEVPVEKIVEVRVEVPVEKIVEKKRVEVPVEKLRRGGKARRHRQRRPATAGPDAARSRFVDFIQEDVAPYTDAEIGAAAAWCTKAAASSCASISRLPRAQRSRRLAHHIAGRL
jgi:hypothetical protein